MGIFQKIKRGAGRFFKKVADGTGDFFKKGGYLSTGLDYANKGLQYGGKILNAIDRVPILSSVLSPLTTTARTALNLGNRLVSGIQQGQGLVQDVGSAIKKGDVRGVAQGVGNVLEKAKEVKADIDKGPKFA